MKLCVTVYLAWVGLWNSVIHDSWWDSVSLVCRTHVRGALVGPVIDGPITWLLHCHLGGQLAHPFFVGCAGAVLKGWVMPGPCLQAAVNVRLGLCFTVVGSSVITYLVAWMTCSNNSLGVHVDWASCVLSMPSHLGGQLALMVNSLTHMGCFAQRNVTKALFTSVCNYCVRLVGCFSFAGQILPVS